VRLTVIGCTGSVAGPDSPASCYVVEADGCRMVLDLGNGALGPLQRHLDLATVDAVLLSHLHPDHCVDMCGFYVALRYGPGGGAHPRIPVWGPDGTAHRLAQAYGLPVEPGMTGEFDFRTFPDGAFDIGPFRVRARQVVHPVTAYALRVEHAGRALAYSGDTAPTPALVDVAKGADVLLCEAAFQDGDNNPAGLHLTGREAGEHATAAGVGSLVVTHVPPWGDVDRARAEAAQAFDGPVVAARSGLIVEV
jgi:ribonuclease BN (tRNA processing enzyme)